MSNMRPLPIYPGQVGKYHLNRFRIGVVPPANPAAIAAGILTNMPRYMNSHTARVSPGPLPWNGHPTLRFVGVPRLRPFILPFDITIAGVRYNFVTPEILRELVVPPQIHPDLVGIIQTSSTGFTVQTLKRDYPDESDNLITAFGLRILNLALEATDYATMLIGVNELSDAINDIAGAYETAIETALANYLISINQHHFLAGRRSFRFVPGSVFGYTDGRWVFETAAMERFSLPIFEKSQLLMGDAEDVVRPVWVEMLQQFVKCHGLSVMPDILAGGYWQKDVGGVTFLQRSWFGYNAMIGSREAMDMVKTHPVLHP